MAKPTPIDKVAHKNVKLKPFNFDILKEQHIVPLVAHELPTAAGQFPIVFVKDQESGQFRIVAMLGLKPGENLFMQEGKWDATYLPANFRAYPFSLAALDEEGKNIAVCIDADSELVNEEEGQAQSKRQSKESY